MILSYCYQKPKSKRYRPAIWLHSITDDGADTVTFKLSGSVSGEATLGEHCVPLCDGVAVIKLSSLDDGLYRPIFTFGKVVYRAKPLIIEDGRIIPTEAGAIAVMALSEKCEALLENYKKLLDKCDCLEEKIGKARSFSLI